MISSTQTVALLSPYFRTPNIPTEPTTLAAIIQKIYSRGPCAASNALTVGAGFQRKSMRIAAGELSDPTPASWDLYLARLLFISHHIQVAHAETSAHSPLVARVQLVDGTVPAAPLQSSRVFAAHPSAPRPFRFWLALNLERPSKLIGKRRTSEVRMGTFHALYARFLRKFSKVDFLASTDITLKDGTVLSFIFKAKSKGLTTKAFVAEHTKANERKSSSDVDPQDNIQRLVGKIYDEDEKSLGRSNSLDFDDLLLFGLNLFKEHTPATSWYKHVLFDEFQDTNVTQYELIRAIGAPTGQLGATSQSWRSTDVGNLARMRKDFAGAEQIFLEGNGRSTSILKASLDISQVVTLLTFHPSGPTPVLRAFPSEHTEAAFITVDEYSNHRHVELTLDATSSIQCALPRYRERAAEGLLKEGISSAVLGGHKFFERLETHGSCVLLELSVSLAPKRAAAAAGAWGRAVRIGEVLGTWHIHSNC
ncbi:P-loop containing nucleoside triphosphate hydrolase protein [Mycena rosella]|uniref:P-loop containing nucleoside triphosphate hydrolase protein n=1 Tax=Mycena rosella TaxID=1033263 RepID=A0AAD7D2X8_MYCRO|nr:P-loop containing nucleoside triphosphate hydrolase protein [Mycena rosella]